MDQVQAVQLRLQTEMDGDYELGGVRISEHEVVQSAAR